MGLRRMTIGTYKMPKKPIDYSKIVIYKLVCNDLDVKEIYVGHTTNFAKRKIQHRSVHFNRNNGGHNFYVYQYIRANGGFNNWSMIEIEKFPCCDRNEACKRERFWIESLHATLNKRVPSRTHSEYYELNKRVFQDNAKRYYERNKEVIKDTSKQYYELNKEVCRDQQKQYRELNKEAIHKLKNRQFICKCGDLYTQCNKARHDRSKKHIYAINTQYEYFWDDGTQCTKEEYDNNLH